MYGVFVPLVMAMFCALATPKGEVMDMFWGDRCGAVLDPEGYLWMVATHIAQPTPKEMQQKMKEEMAIRQAARAASGS